MCDTEREFLGEIDCRFPYNDEARWKSLVNRGIAISPNAAFAVLYEICAPGAPGPDSPKAALLIQILEYWKSHFDHPAIDIVMPSTLALINRDERTEKDTIAAMQRLMDFPGLDFALNILNYACDDTDGRVERTWRAVGNHWQAAS